jgi:hypothetical protein
LSRLRSLTPQSATARPISRSFTPSTSKPSHSLDHRPGASRARGFSRLSQRQEGRPC